MTSLVGTAFALTLALAAVWALAEIGLRVVLGWPLDADFHGAIPRSALRARQQRHGVQLVNGAGWSHLGWISDPRRERYRVERFDGERWLPIARPRFGSCLVRVAGRHRVCAVARWRPGGALLVLGDVDAAPLPAIPLRFAPRRAGPWRTLFRPRRAGDYVNDHTVFRDRAGRWRLLGITGTGSGDYTSETRFAHAVSDSFPPAHEAGALEFSTDARARAPAHEAGESEVSTDARARAPAREMDEVVPVADFGEIAWAPFVLESAGRWHLWWSPHRLWHASSADGEHWGDRDLAMRAPMHRFFRDASVMEVAPGQWLLHATGRGRWFSRVDCYQSFDLAEWQYIGPALRGRPGSERNAAFASMETPSVVPFGGRFHLVFTYDNGSRISDALGLVLRRRPRQGYDDTRVVDSDNPYCFGDYRGWRRTPSRVARLQAHAPRLVRHPETGAWWVTTAGWPWAATLTAGEVAVAPLVWEPLGGQGASDRGGAPAPAGPARDA